MSQLVPRTPELEEGDLPIPAPSQVAPAVFDPFAGIGESKSNLPMTDPDGKRLHDVALNGDHPRLADHVNMAFDLYAYVVHPYQAEDPNTGEVFTRARLVLVTHDGNFYQSGGFYTLESLARLVRSNGTGPWHPPIRVCVQSAPNKHGGRVYKLVPVVPESQRMPWQPLNTEGKKRAKNA